MAVLGATIVGGGGVVWWYLSRWEGHMPRWVAVLPFANLAGAAELDSLAESLISELSQFRELRGIGRSASRRFRGRGWI